eukprot:m.228485 g.228485  ORF g.228485 m.228485 type:complete len:434 (-) comp15979_c0_seq8:2991-4292(-)
MGFKYYRFIFTFFLILCLSSLYSVATRDGKQNALPLLQRKWYNEVRGAQVYLHKKRQICAKGGDQPHTDCHINSYLRRRLTEKHRCSQLDAHHIQNAFRLRMTFWKHCNKYSRLNTSVAHWVDKARAKELVERNVPELKVVKTLAVIYHPADIMAPGFLDKFPNSFVMKGTHGSQMTLIVTNKTTYKCINGSTAQTGKHCLTTQFNSIEDSLYAHCEHWLNVDFGKDTRQKYYSAIEPACIFEESLLDKDGNFPRDVKYYTGGGQILSIQHFHPGIDGRGNAEPYIVFKIACFTIYHCCLFSYSLPDYRSVYLQNPEMCKEDVENTYSSHKEFNNSKSEEIAKIVAKLFSYVRVDFYDTNPPLLQEVTLTPANCVARVKHHKFTSWLWGYIMMMQDNIAPSCIARANYVSLCNSKLHDFLWSRWSYQRIQRAD